MKLNKLKILKSNPSLKPYNFSNFSYKIMELYFAFQRESTLYLHKHDLILQESF